MSDAARMPDYDVNISRQPEGDDEDIPRHEFTAEHELHLFPLDMAEITCPDCEATMYPDDLGEALDWALGHACVPVGGTS